MQKTVLFVADGSIKNPILHSQGIPLYEVLAGVGYNPIFLTFEKETELEAIKEEFGNLFVKQAKIKFIQVVLTENKLWPAGIQNIIKGLYKIIVMVIKYDVKIIHARSFTPSLISIIVKALFFGKVSVLFDNRGVLIEEEILKGNWQRNSTKVKILSFIEEKIVEYADRIVVVSSFFKKYLVKKYTLLKLEKKISVIQNATKLSSSDIDSKVNSSDEIICVYSGSAAPWQKTDKVFEMFLAAKEESSKIKFKIITYETKLFKELAEEYSSIVEDVEIVSVPSEKVSNELSKCDFGLLIRDDNLVNNVASPLKFAEYLAAGLPVIVSENVGDTGEIISNYKVGVVLRGDDFRDAINEILELLKDKDLPERCRMVAKKEFDIDKTIEKYLNIYEELL